MLVGKGGWGRGGRSRWGSGCGSGGQDAAWRKMSESTNVAVALSASREEAGCHTLMQRRGWWYLWVVYRVV